MRDLTLYEEPIRKYSQSDEKLEFFHGFEDEFDEEFYSNETGHRDDCQCKICREKEELFEVTELEHGLLDEGFDFELERSAYPGISCFTAGNPYVLHCFPPFETELTKEQHKHLDIIAKMIQRSFSSSKPISRVMIVGHSSTWHKTSSSKLQKRSIQRAGNAGNQLILRLLPMGLAKKVDIHTDGRSNKVKWLGKSYSSTSGTQKAKNNRALNRRVEIRLIKSSKKKEDPKASCELGDALKEVGLTRAPHAERLECLRNILILGVSKKAVDDRFWTFTGSDALGTKTICVIRRVPSAHEGTKFIRIKPYRWHNRPAVFLDRNDKPLRVVQLFKDEMGTSCDLKKIYNIMIWLEQAMYCNLEMLGQYIEQNCDTGPSGFKKDPNCAFVHSAYNLATKRKTLSVYKCFERVLKEYKATCIEGCYR